MMKLLTLEVESSLRRCVLSGALVEESDRNFHGPSARLGFGSLRRLPKGGAFACSVC